MPERKVGKILSEHEERLVEAGLDMEQAEALVDELEDELNSLMEVEQEDVDPEDDQEYSGKEETDQEGEEDNEESDAPEDD
jgi:hypothetical protein